MKNVVLISHSQLLGGAERCLIDLCIGLNLRGYVVTIIFPAIGPNFTIFEQNSKHCHVVPYPWWLIKNMEPFQFIKAIISHLYATYNLIKLLKKLKPDIILNNTIAVPSGALAARILKIPLVWFIHEFGDKDHGFKFLLGKKLSMKFINYCSTEILVNSNFLKNYYKGMGISKPITIAPINIELKQLNYKKFYDLNERKQNLGIYIIGQIQPSKGQHIVLEAFQMILREFQQAQLFIIGQISDSFYYDGLLNYINSNNLKCHVTIYPHVSNPFELIRGFPIGIVASQFEAFGRITIEYMNLKIPVIAANKENNSNLINHGENGFLFDTSIANSLFDQVKMLLNMSSSEIEKLVSNAENFSKTTYNMDMYVTKVEGVLVSSFAKNNN